MDEKQRRRAIFQRRDRQRDQMMRPATRLITAVLLAERARIRTNPEDPVQAITLEPWLLAMERIHLDVAGQVWAETVDDILGTGKQVDPAVLRRIANNPGALRAVGVGARNAATRIQTRNRAQLQAQLQAAEGDLAEAMEALYSDDQIGTRAARVARNEVLDVASDFQAQAIEATDAAVDKSWLSRRDAKVRATHGSADARYRPGGEPGPIPAGEPFIVGGYEMMRPRDRSSAPPSETAECRCQSLPVAAPRTVR